ncbi:MAG: PhoH family protein [Candidatus Eremiobacteraeota bacterium]|nr:PhoH family protein [Candidatus Eremiobacteraeota bacterium]
MAETVTERKIDLDGLHEPVRLFGQFDQNISALEAAFPVSVHVEGNQLVLHGAKAAVDRAQRAFRRMLDAALNGATLTPDDVALAAADALEPATDGVPETLYVAHRGREIRPRTRGQRAFVQAIEAHSLTFGIGPAGTGKTFLAVVMAIRALRDRKVARVVLSRPAVEAGEKLGFLPGDYKEKVDPYLRPLYDALGEILDDAVVSRYIERGIIEVAPLAYMRGRTLADAFVILDEAQNATREQLKMFLTRLGNASRMVVNGDVTQIDLPRGATSGLLEVSRLFAMVPDVAIVNLKETDCVRHPLVSRIIRAYASFSESPG